MNAVARSRIGGTFPGGPHRSGPSPRQGHRALPPTAKELEERIERHGLERSHARRVRRVRLCFICAAALSAAIGFTIGLTSHTTQAELSEAVQAQQRRDADISKEVNRTLLELWKMEDFESARNQGRTR